MWQEILAELENREDLTSQQTSFAMSEILEGRASDNQIRSFLLGLKEKGETATEVLSLVSVMYQHAAPLEVPERAVDSVGTGGDGLNTINISTSAAIVTTAAGARVIKHGNRAASSKSGSADLLEALGINIELNGEQVAECVRRIGIGFAYAPKFHPAMRFAAPVRKALGAPTIFNILGPLANPARPKAVAIGVARKEMMELVAKVLAERGCEGFVFRGLEGLDEISTDGPTEIYQVNRGRVVKEIFDPSEIGSERFPISDLVGGDAIENAAITQSVFSGKRGAAREAILLNAAAAIAAFKGDFDLGVQQQIANGYVLAKTAIDSGKAFELLQRWREVSNELAKSSL
jgi:anthranilate phosphoribosyltransferase